MCLQGTHVLGGDLLGLMVVSRVLRWWRLGDSRLKDFHFLRVLLCPKRRCGQRMFSAALCDGGWEEKRVKNEWQTGILGSGACQGLASCEVLPHCPRIGGWPSYQLLFVFVRTYSLKSLNKHTNKGSVGGGAAWVSGLRY